MKRFFDVVNFNPDASCLYSEQWIEALKGGRSSTFYRWLELYPKHQKPVNLGLTGSSIADIQSLNPEAIELINSHPKIFQLVIRPFAHDISLLRSRRGFELNVEYGQKIIRSHFKNISDFYLPPEFMVTAEQIEMLSRSGLQGVFINSSRMRGSPADQLPPVPYLVRGILESKILCLPFAGALTNVYLRTIQLLEPQPWNGSVLSQREEDVFFWRDGESAFLVPQGVEREEFWLANESCSIHRKHLSNYNIPSLNSLETRIYPLHPFSAWLREFRLMGFLRRMFSIENMLDSMTPKQLGLWFYLINSDILSSVEKTSPRVPIRRIGGGPIEEFVIHRSDRHTEGEECLVLLEAGNDDFIDSVMRKSQSTYLIKLKARIHHLRTLIEQ